MRLLERLGQTPAFPLEQTCCGQLHLNSGYPDEATLLARRFVSTFADSDVIVSPSASCVGMVREQYPHLAERSDDAAFAHDVAELVPRVLELTELLVDRLGVEDVGARFERPPCYVPPDLPFAAGTAPRRPPSGSCARCRDSSSSSCATPRSAAASAARSPSTARGGSRL